MKPAIPLLQFILSSTHPLLPKEEPWACPAAAGGPTKDLVIKRSLAFHHCEKKEPKENQGLLKWLILLALWSRAWEGPPSHNASEMQRWKGSRDSFRGRIPVSRPGMSISYSAEHQRLRQTTFAIGLLPLRGFNHSSEKFFLNCANSPLED